MPHTTGPAPRASVDVGTVRQRFNWDWAESNPIDDVDTWFWYAISIRVDPAEVIADDGEGNLWSVPFTTDGEDVVTFGTPVRVRETFVPITAGNGAAASAASARVGQRTLASALERPTKPDRSTHLAASSRPEPQEDKVPDITPDQLQRLRALPEDATQEQINEAIGQAPEAPEVETPPVVPAAEAEAPETPETQPAERELAPVASSKTVTVDRDQWEQTQRNAEVGAAAARRAAASELDAEADQAVKDGRITPASRGEWRASIDPGENPDATALARAAAERKALAGLAKGRVPVDELRGNASTTETGQLETTGWFNFDDKKGA